MEKVYVTYKQALRLKELGFDESVPAWYNHLQELRGTEDNEVPSTNSQSFSNLANFATAPTVYQAKHWLRKNLDFNIAVNVKDFEGKPMFFWKTEKYESILLFDTYEEAVCDGIDAALKELTLKR